MITELRRNQINEASRRWRKSNPRKYIESQKNYRSNYPLKVKETQRRWREKNRDYDRKRKILWNSKNREKIRKQRIEYIKNNYEKIRSYERQRYKKNLQAKLAKCLRTRTLAALRGKSKQASAVKFLGCSLENALTYIESQFKVGMTWKNWTSKGWHLDHKRPLSSFDLENQSQFNAASHYTNLQPLWWYENLSKNARITC